MEVDEMVSKAKSGDKEALVKLIMLRQKEYYKLAYIYMKNKEDSLDALEDMIVILYENIRKLKKEEAFYSWSKTILVNCCKKLLKEKRKVVLIDKLDERLYEPVVNKQEDQIVLEDKLSKLSPKHQEVIRMRYYLDLDYESISNLLKIPIGTVKSRISIGINKLRESLGGDKYEGY